MISCSKIREILMTSYIDTELDEAKKREIDSHIEKCRSCRELRDILVKDINGAFEKSELTAPADDVWNRIREKVSPREEEAAYEPVWWKIRRFVLRPVPATAGAAIAFMAVFLIFISVMNVKGPGYNEADLEQYFGKQVRFLDYLDSNGRDYYPVNDHIGLLTPIEKYLF